jgi:hypothetical protein
MKSGCPGCGARLAHSTCGNYFDTCQAREFEQPAYFSVHDISVPCYLLQHNMYSREGWLMTREYLRKSLSSSVRPSVIADSDREKFDSSNRTWSFTKGEKLAGVENIVWSRTIADLRLGTAEQYCADVLMWGKSILADTEALIQIKADSD